MKDHITLTIVIKNMKNNDPRFPLLKKILYELKAAKIIEMKKRQVARRDFSRKIKLCLSKIK